MDKVMNKHFLTEGIHNIFIYVGIFQILTSFTALTNKWVFHIDDVILKSEIVCEQPQNNRCGIEYITKNKNGEIEVKNLSYAFGKGDLSKGDHVEKSIFTMTYKVNGKIFKTDFVIFYVKQIFYGMLSMIAWLIVSYYLFKHKRRSL